MKQFLLLTTCVLLVASQSVNASGNKPSSPSGAIFATGPADGGRLYIRRSPVLGANVAVTVKIDGQRAGTVMWGHTYDRYITPGRHVLRVSPDNGGAWQTTLNVRAGKTYAYGADYNVNKLVLTPTSVSN